MTRLSRVLAASLVCLSLARVLGAVPPTPPADRSTVPVPAALVERARAVPDSEMQRVYEEVKTPHKYGIILRPGEGESVDCPNVFRHGDRWYMLYVSIKDEVGYGHLLQQRVHYFPCTGGNSAGAHMHRDFYVCIAVAQGSTFCGLFLYSF